MTTEVAPFSVIDVLVGKSLGRGVPMPTLKRSPEIVDWRIER